MILVELCTLLPATRIPLRPESLRPHCEPGRAEQASTCHLGSLWVPGHCSLTMILVELCMLLPATRIPLCPESLRPHCEPGRAVNTSVCYSGFLWDSNYHMQPHHELVSAPPVVSRPQPRQGICRQEQEFCPNQMQQARLHPSFLHGPASEGTRPVEHVTLTQLTRVTEDEQWGEVDSISDFVTSPLPIALGEHLQ
ncbi:hypothetical protein P7K49_013369 [Saguinus oedipus]|uniref:Uncharacterized protein n=1 Tax=Saguinus oedipus TaxID=9490 RepID=A0ABQ9VH31_SAGOE|nr:hypothetical protein P7K49_013369 [Saguinus oedipus]